VTVAQLRDELVPGIQTLLLGSVSDKVIRHAKCPVTVVN
jgi:nucleotide-binding universal stress UspA family protein